MLNKKNIISLIEKGIVPSPSEVLSDDKAWFLKIYDFDFKSIQQDSVEEYIFHSPSNIQIKLYGITITEKLNFTLEEFELALNIICLRNNINWNVENPFASFDYKEFRATLVHSKCFKESSSKLFLRVHTKKIFSLRDFNLEEKFTNDLIKNRKNIIIAGSTGSGKTSLINTFLSYTKEDEHLFIAEDTYELISPHANTTRMVANENSKYQLESYMSYAMRMRPERIVLGEIRSKEVIPFLLALNTGHQGVISSVHANSAKDVIMRIAILYKVYCENDISMNTILKFIAQNIDQVIYVKNKKVTEIINILGAQDENIFYENQELVSF